MPVMTRESVTAALQAFERREIPLAGRRAAAVAVAVLETPAGPAVPVTRRADGLRAHPGQWALPGGRVDPGETAVGAAIREADEELGLRLDASDCLGLLDDFATRSGYVMTPVVIWGGPAAAMHPNPAEVASVHLATGAELDVEPRFVTIPESDRPVVQLPLFGTLVHAPTAAVLHQFREVAIHGRSTRVAHFEQPVFAWR
jgi:8-oxo-dGTP pyrophosphatase MutT (NUDIX family)